MIVSKQLREWLIANGHSPDVKKPNGMPDHAAHKPVVEKLILDGTLTAEKIVQIIKGETMSTTVDPSAVFARPGHVRVKDTSEAFSTKRAVGLHTKTGQQVLNPLSRKPCELPSELDHAKTGAFLKHLAAKSGLFGSVSIPEHEKALLAESCEQDNWSGTVNGEHYDSIAGGTHIKALVDDAASGGVEIVPFFMDANFVTFPLLSGELLPFVDMVSIHKGRRIMGGSIGNPTLAWGQADDIEVGLFDTANLVMPLDSTVFGCAVSVRVGRDFLSDSAGDVGATLTQNVGQRMAAELDRVISVGNGATEPQGILTAAGMLVAPSDNGLVGPPTLDDYTSLFFSVGKQYRSPNLKPRFLSNDTSYMRSRQIAVDPLGPAGVNQLPVLAPLNANQGFNDYVTLGSPHSVQNTIGNSSIAFGCFSKYRLYKRLGLEVQWVNGGETLARRNEVLLVVRGRYAGRLMDVNAFARCNDSQA